MNSTHPEALPSSRVNKNWEILSGFSPGSNFQLALPSGLSLSQKSLRDYPASAREPPFAGSTLPKRQTPSFSHVSRQRNTFQMWTTPQGPRVTLPRPWCCRTTRCSKREETLILNTETAATTVQSLPESTALAPEVTQSAHAYWSPDGLLGPRSGPFSSGAWPWPRGRRLLVPRNVRVSLVSP